MNMFEAIAKDRVSQVPSRAPVQVGPGERLGNVVTLMRNRRTGAALVVDRDELIGIFTERDLLARVDHGSHAWRDRPVREVMTARPMIIREDDSVGEALRRIDVGKRRHLPVVRGRAPIAIISVRDLLGYVARKFPAEFINLPPSPEREAREPWGG
jgi:CBS domain-containing protein